MVPLTISPIEYWPYLHDAQQIYGWLQQTDFYKQGRYRKVRKVWKVLLPIQMKQNIWKGLHVAEINDSNSLDPGNRTQT